ncbi:MAG TPA: hypothetical protein VEH82_08945, partial [Acidimicrobiales bacterium]|nr:hypothetical protein [Acidimicrobiales bacterium]
MTEERAPWLTRLERVLGHVGPARPIGGNVFSVEVGGLALVAKLGEAVADEADGLRRLAAVPGAPPVPAVVLT